MKDFFFLNHFSYYSHFDTMFVFFKHTIFQNFLGEMVHSKNEGSILHHQVFLNLTIKVDSIP